MNFGKKILLFMFIGAILPVILTTLAYFLYFEPSVKKSIENGINNITISMGDEINQLITESIQNSRLLAQNQDLTDVDLRRTRDFHKIFKDISIVNPEGKVLKSAGYSFRGEIKETKWFREALKGDIIVSEIHALVNPFEIVMTAMSPVYDSSFCITKIIVAQLDIDHIWTIVNRKAIRTGAEICLIDNNGIIVYSTDENMLLEKYPIKSIYEQSKEMNHFVMEKNIDGIKKSFFLNPIEKDFTDYSPDWNVLYIEESNKVYTTLVSFRKLLFARGIFSLLLISSLSILLSRSISTRIKKLRDATLKLSEGDYSIKISDKANDEVSDLIRSFSYAQQQLEISESNIKSANERYELAVEGANDVIFDWDLTSDSIYFAPKWFEVIGEMENESFTAESWFNTIHFSDKERFKKKLNAAFEENSTHFEEEYRIVKRDNSVKWLMTRGIILYDNNGKSTRMAGSHSDITERITMQEKVSFYAYYDSLTELPNRTKLLDRMKQALNRAERKEDYSFCLLYLDFDGFKHVNDTYGHPIGDVLLKMISQRLLNCVRPLDLVSRVGGDEFIILLDGVKNDEFIPSILNRLLKASRDEFLIEDHSIYISVSIGIIEESQGLSNADDLIQKADIAMYYSKLNGKDKYTFFKEDLQEHEISRWSLEHELHNALGTPALSIYYQPIIDSQSEKIFSFEALLRWHHPLKGMIPPDEFIPSAEETGFICQITKWLLVEICKQAVQWNRIIKNDSIKISFNVTAKDFLIPGGMDYLIEETLIETGCLPGWIALEVTEGIMITDFGAVMKQIRKIRMSGVAIELDDFGTGYSSLSYLNKFEIDYLKIDQSFIRSMLKDQMSLKIVKTIINLAHDLDLRIIAEGVETEEEARQLSAWGCEYFQGYHYSKPLNHVEAEIFLNQNINKSTGMSSGSTKKSNISL